MSTLSDLRVKSVQDIENEVRRPSFTAFIISININHDHFKIVRRHLEFFLIVLEDFYFESGFV